MENEVEVDDFDSTINWASQEEISRIGRGNCIGSFYLIVCSIIIFFIVVLFLIYANKGRVDIEDEIHIEDERSALEMMQDEDNIYGEQDYDINLDNTLDNNVNNNADNDSIDEVAT